MLSQSFLFEHGPRAMHLRSVVMEILGPRNMKSLAPQINGHIMRIIGEIKKEHFEGEGKGKFKEIVLNDKIDELFSHIICTFLFGNTEEKLLKVPKMTEQSLAKFDKASGNLLNEITLNMARDLQILQDAKDAVHLEKTVRKTLSDLIKERSNEKTYKLRDNNIVDLMIKANIEETNEKEKMTEREMVDNILILVFAGIDTSRHTSKASLHFLSYNPIVRKKVVEHVRSLVETEDKLKFENSEVLDRFMLETLRLRSPVPAYINRITTKNFKLGEYKIYKNTMLSIPFSRLHKNNDYWENPDDFEIENHTQEKTRKETKLLLFHLEPGKETVQVVILLLWL